MLCSNIKQIILTKSTLNSTGHYQYIISSNPMFKRFICRGWFISKHEYTGIGKTMSPLRYIFKDLVVARFLSAWTRSNLVNNVVRRCRKDRSVREVFHCFRQTFFRPRRTLLLSATAAFRHNDDEDEDNKVGCDRNITDEEIEELVTELDGIEELSKSTLFCFGCGRRLVIDKKLPSVIYCSCEDTKSPSQSNDGWVPYMEAEDVIIWRKEYKTGQGLYAYKVYGRYREVRAQDFAAVQVDGAYRRVWDSAVASLCVVERNANGVRDQAVLHWEVLWPRLFANRDYVYIRRHKEFDVRSKCHPHKDTLFERSAPKPVNRTSEERPSVHSNAKRRSLETYSLKRNENIVKDNKVFVIVSKSCEHPRVPVSKNAIRVSEYWSHMVIKTLDGADQAGMEFVLTYYDEPAVGGLPYGVAMWATTRAATAFLDRMRTAALNYNQRGMSHDEDLPEFAPPVTQKQTTEETKEPERTREEDYGSSKHGPELNGNHKETDEKREKEIEPERRDQSTQTESEESISVSKDSDRIIEDKSVGTRELVIEGDLSQNFTNTTEGASQKAEDVKEENGSWWRYLYPFYYFV